MECKYCGAQLDEEVTLCPLCGKENAEPEQMDTQPEQTVAEETELAVEETAEAIEETTEAAAEAMEEVEEIPEQEQTQKAKINGWKIVALALAGVLVFGILAGALLYGFGVDFKPKQNDIFYMDSYTVSEKKADTVASYEIATAGGKVLTNADLQVYYNMTVNDFVNYYGYYLSSIGLDTTKPFEEQACSMQEGMTWQQYFLENALNVWHRYTVLNLLAEEEGITLASALQQQLDNLPQQMDLWASQYGFSDAQSMLKADFGPICTLDAYYDYMQVYYLAMQYQEEKQSAIEPTDEEVEAYFTANQEAFEQSGITKDGGSYYDVRHILIEPENGVEDDTGLKTYTDEAWAECLVKAEELLEQWKSGDATETAFADMAAQYSVDTGSSSNGGLYTQLTTETSFVEEFKAWYLDETRQPGDTGIVKSIYGYHIMYFSGSQPIWQSSAKTTLLSEKWNQLIDEGAQKWPMEITYKKIALCDRTEEEQQTETTVPTQATADTVYQADTTTPTD